MEHRIAQLALIALCWVTASAVNAESIEYLHGDWEIATEASLVAMAEREGLTDSQLEEHRSKLIEDLDFKQPRLGIDEQQLGLVIGNKTMVMDYQVTRATNYSVNLNITFEGQPVEGRIERYGDHLIRLVLGGNNDWYVWQRASGGESALSDRFVQPPPSDNQADQPEDAFKRLARLADQNDFDSIHAAHSPTSRSRNTPDDIATRWAQFNIGLGYDDLQVRETSTMAQHPGVWFVEARYQRGKRKGPIFSLYFKTIDGSWHVVSQPDLQ